ncbi:MAG: helix-hairpin-helix domain-containing protein [Clostridiales Family XIII bacterium]|jgi:competence protein ComEA|nr:helix-hairpin-helix domain-containing protein [Clostridiales Family XIII bacterium]
MKLFKNYKFEMDMRNPRIRKKVIKILAITLAVLIILMSYAIMTHNRGDSASFVDGDGNEIKTNVTNGAGDAEEGIDHSEKNKTNDTNGEDNGDSLNATDSSILKTDGDIYVDVCGAVSNPSVVKIKAGSRVEDAINAAGGTTEHASIKTLNRAKVVADGDKIYVMTLDEEKNMTPSEYYAEAQAGILQSSDLSESQGDNSTLININTADSLTLQNINGVGPSTADKIITYRESNGLFNTIEDLKKVSGIGEKTFEKLKDSITV